MAPITKSDILTLALLLSVGLNIYEMTKDLCPAYCNDEGRYPDREQAFGGAEVEESWAKNHILRFREEHVGDLTYYKTTGFMLSKKAIDNIFNQPLLNTLCLDLIVDDHDVLSLIAKGTVTDSTMIDCSIKDGIFINQSMCPNDCSQY